MSRISPVNHRTFDRDTSKLRKVPVSGSKTDFSQMAESPLYDTFERESNSVSVHQTSIRTLGNKLIKQARNIKAEADKKSTNAYIEYVQAENVADTDFGDSETYSGDMELKPNVSYFNQRKRSFDVVIPAPDGKAVRILIANMDDDFNINAIYKGYEGTAERFAAEEAYIFSDGELQTVMNNFSKNNDDVSAGEVFEYKFGEFFDYKKGFKKEGTKTTTDEEYIIFDGKLRRYYKDIFIDNLVSKIGESFIFDNKGKMIEYSKNTVMEYDKTKNTLKSSAEALYSINKNGNLKKIQ